MSFLDELPFASLYPSPALGVRDRSKPWKPPANFDRDDMASLNDENDRLRRELCAMTRAYNSTKKELEDLKETTGFYEKALPFLQLPREVRDQIYGYAFLAPSNIRPEHRPMYLLSLEPLSWKPETPGFCLANKQIHLEAIEILYGKNTFYFQNPGELIRFEEQIGASNRALIRSLEISTAVISKNSFVPDPDYVAPCDWQGNPTHWSMALMMSQLKNVVEMRIRVEDRGSAEQNMVTMSPVLQQAIVNMLQRNPDRDMKRRLTLKGFGHSEQDKFPRDWEVKIEQRKEVEDTRYDEEYYYSFSLFD
jgi:hypothetical protein